MDKKKFDIAIGAAMNKIKRSDGSYKPQARRVLTHLNLARQINELGHPQIVQFLVRQAQDIIRAANAGDPVPLPPTEKPEARIHLDRAIGRCMGAVKRAGTERKAITKLGLAHLNAARALLDLGYSDLSAYMVRSAHEKFTTDRVQAATADPDEAGDFDILKTPERPAPPRHPNPLMRAFDTAKHKVQTTLDRRGFVT